MQPHHLVLDQYLSPASFKSPFMVGKHEWMTEARLRESTCAQRDQALTSVADCAMDFDFAIRAIENAVQVFCKVARAERIKIIIRLTINAADKKVFHC